MFAEDAALPTTIAIAVVRRGGTVLVGRRGPDAVLGGKAEFPGGKVEPGESIAEAAQRECLEETGLEVEAVGEALATGHRYEHGLLELHFIECRAVRPDAAPRAPFRWVPLAELASLNFPAANAAIVARLAADR